MAAFLLHSIEFCSSRCHRYHNAILHSLFNTAVISYLKKDTVELEISLVLIGVPSKSLRLSSLEKAKLENQRS